MSVSRTGNPEALREARFGAADGASDTSSRLTLSAGDGGPVVVPDEALLRDGEFLRQGGDLVIRGSDGAEVVVQGYFAAETRPNLTTAGGDVALSPGLVDSFLSAMAPGQYAQTAGSAQSPIGQVDELKGEAFAVRADGTRMQLAKGDPVFEGDIVETGGGGSAIRMVFIDKTMFALGSDARLALDELVFDPSHLSGSSQFSILKGVFIFSSGEIAKTDNTEMTVITPVAAIGIRGTEVAGRVDGANSQFTIIDGAIEVTTQAGSVTLDGAGETTLVSGIDAAPSQPHVLSAAEYGAAYGGVTSVAPTHFSLGGRAAGDSGFEDAGLPSLGSDGDEDQARDLDGAGSDPGTSHLTAWGAPAAEITGPVDAGTPDPVSDLAREISETVEYQLAAALTLEPSSEPGGLQGETDDTGAGGDSPYRTETADLDVFWNPYVPSEPYGTIQFTTDGDDADAASGEAAGSAQDESAEDGGYAELPSPQAGATESGGGVEVPPPSPPAPAAIVLTVSNAIDTTDFASQDRTNSFELFDHGPDSSATVLGSAMGLPGVAAGAAVDVARDSAGNVDIELTTAWNSVKNLYAASDQAADISIRNFVHADLDFGNGGDSHIVLDAVKRGFITTGDGDDTVDIAAFTNIDTWSKRVDVNTGDGDDTVLYLGSSNGLSELTFTAGAGTDTLVLTGAGGQTFDLSSGQYQLTGVEHIDMSAAPDTTLQLSANMVSKLMGSGLNELTGTEDTLVVSGAAGDRLDLANGGSWMKAAEHIDIAGESYAIYEHSSGVRVAADQDIAAA